MRESVPAAVAAGCVCRQDPAATAAGIAGRDAACCVSRDARCAITTFVMGELHNASNTEEVPVVVPVREPVVKPGCSTD